MLRLRLLSLTTLTLLVLTGCSTNTGGEPQRSAAATPTVVVLDASESMLENDAPGSRWDAATQAVEALVDSLPSGTEFGLVVFGSQSAATRTPANQACRDVKKVLPLGVTDSTRVRTSLKSLTPQGFTPIGNALEAAAEMLPDGESSLVLVSDGESTCEPDPCTVASQIRAAHPKTTLSTIGFRTDADSLQCVAERGGGIFLTADNAAQLTSRLAATQNTADATTRLLPTARDGIKIGTSLKDVAAANPGFPTRGTKTDSTTVIVWKDCTYVFDEDSTLIEIAPGSPPGTAGTTVDGVTAGTAGQRAVELYGEPVDDTDGVALFVADEDAGTAYRIGYRDGDDIGSGTVTTVALCHCLPREQDKPAPVLGRAKFDTYAEGFGTTEPTAFSIASTASSSVNSIDWESWGQANAIGKGRSQQNGAGQPQSETWVLATDLGWCDGVWTYRALQRATSRADVETRNRDYRDICKADRSAPAAPSESVTLNPRSLLTFGGVGGVYVGDPASKIPNTYVRREVAGPGKFETGTVFYYFNTGSTDAYDAEIHVGPDEKIRQISWFATDRGIRIGSSEAEVARAYKSEQRQTCKLSSLGSAPFYTDANGRNIIFVITDGKVLRIRATVAITDSSHCPFE